VDSTIIVAIIISLPGMMAAVLAYLAQREARATLVQAKETHIAVNSRMTELLEVTKRMSEGKGRDEERASQAAAKAGELPV
jgi:esterase/lipase